MVTVIDGIPLDVSRWEAVVPPNLVDPSVARAAWAMALLASRWMAKR